MIKCHKAMTLEEVTNGQGSSSYVLNMAVLNSYLLNLHFGKIKLRHDEYKNYIVKYLIQQGRLQYNLAPPPVLSRHLGIFNTNEANQTSNRKTFH